MATGYDIHGLPFSALTIFSQYNPVPDLNLRSVWQQLYTRRLEDNHTSQMGFEHET
jgi:hypothetical protein